MIFYRMGFMYKHRQHSTWLWAALGTFVVIGLTLIPFLFWLGLFYIGLGFLMLMLFQGLTVEINETHIKMAYGLGVIRRYIELQDIESVNIVKNSFWWGFGIRRTPKGWMWNISGLTAIEIIYKSSKKFRIGTDDAENLHLAINSMLYQDVGGDLRKKVQSAE